MIKYYRPTSQAGQRQMANSSPRHFDSQRNAADPDSDHEGRRARQSAPHLAEARPAHHRLPTAGHQRRHARRHEDEIEGASIRRTFAQSRTYGFVTNSDHTDVVIRYSTRWPCRRRRTDRVQSRSRNTRSRRFWPTEYCQYLLQCQTGLLVTGRKMADFISYCGGCDVRQASLAVPEIHRAILDAALAFEQRLAAAQARHDEWRSRQPVVIHTGRTIEQEIMI